MNELEALALQAETIDSETAATEPGAIVAQNEAAQDLLQQGENVTQVRMVLDLAVPLLGALYPSLPAIYHDQQRELIAASLGPVLTKYNISLSDWGTAYKEEIGALMICGPVAWATVQAIKADIASREPQPPKAGDLRAARQSAVLAESAQPEHVTLG